MVDEEQVRRDVEKAARAASMAMGLFATRNHDALHQCVPVDHDRILIQGTLAYLFSLGLITSAEEEKWEQWLPTDIPEPFGGDLRARLTEAVARRRRLDAAVLR
jgi:hypothetical protein